MKAFRVSSRSRFHWRFLADPSPSLSEEFSIYLNYVRKLGFEETPDYDFLRELFAKVMKNKSDIDDQVYDWNLLNGKPSYLVCCPRLIIDCSFTGGKGWESSTGQNNQTLQQAQNAQTTQRPDVPVPPSPALVRHGSKKDKSPVPLLVPNDHHAVPGTLTPLSGVAQVNVSISPSQPATQQNGHGFKGDSYVGNQTYDRASPMAHNGPQQLSANRPSDSRNAPISEQEENEAPKFSLWKILTCKCS